MIKTISYIDKIVSPIKGWLAYCEILALYRFSIETIKTLKYDEYLLEIGSYQGRSTITMALACKQLNKGIIIAIDPHKKSFEHRTFNIKSTLGLLKKNLKKAKVEKYVRIVAQESETAHKNYNTIKARLIFIDANHEYLAVKKDVDMWYSNLLYGGYLLLHDGLNHYGPRKMVKALLLNPELTFIGYYGDLACFRKVTKLSLRNWLKKIYAVLAINIFLRIYVPIDS